MKIVFKNQIHPRAKGEDPVLTVDGKSSISWHLLAKWLVNGFMARPISLSGVLIMVVVLGCSWGSSLSGAPRVPAVEGPAIRLDFAPPFEVEWEHRGAAAVKRATVPQLRVVGDEWGGDSGLWAQAVELGPLTRDDPATEFHAFHDGHSLFIRARNSFDPGNAPTGVERGRDRVLWDEDEVVEIRLRPTLAEDGDTAPVYHFAVSDGGTMYDARAESSTYDADWQVQVERGEDVWVAWIRIPFAALELDEPLAELEFNIGRYGPNVASTSWGPSWRRTAERRLMFAGVQADPIAAAPPQPGGGEDAAAMIKSIQSGKGIGLDWITGVARPQDRWIRGAVVVEPGVVGSGQKVEITVMVPGSVEPLETLRVTPSQSRGILEIDLRRFEAESVIVTARLLSGDQTVGAASSLLVAEPLPAAFESGFRIPLQVNVAPGPQPGSSWPLYAGVPFPAGQLWHTEGWHVEDDDGNSYAAQFKAVGSWAAQGSIQWLRVDTVADPGRPLWLVYRPDEDSPPVGHPVSIRRENDLLILSNGLVSFELGGDNSPLSGISRNGKPVASASAGRGLYLIDQQGRVATAAVADADIIVESAGPVEACVRIEGEYRLPDAGDAPALARYILRIELSAAMEFARITHTLVLTQDTNEVWFQEAGWEFDVVDGDSAEAIFAIAREDPEQTMTVSLASPTDDVYLLQESHFRFSAGENQFRLVANDTTLRTGGLIGDWFMLQNDAAGLMVACRESARQHPKEFQVAGKNRMVLKLFSGRDGEMLDFRPQALVERWNLQQLAERRLTPEQAALYVEEVKALPSNAVGWAKTHELLLAPAAGRRSAAAVAATAWCHSHPVFVLADPQWIYTSRAMGALYPRDPARFPDVEQRIDAAVSDFAGRAEGIGLRGFIDYEAGPPFGYGRFFRWALTYTLRPDAWRVYARSGERQARDFATMTNRAWADNYLAAWGDDSRVKGLYTLNVGEAAGLPFYWGTRTTTNIRSSTNLNQLIWDYYLTGYRRAADQVRDFADGIRTAVTPASVETDRRIMMTFRALVQCYGFTWDEDLRQLATVVADSFEDLEGAVGLTKDRPLASSTYKTNVDFRALEDGWHILAEPRYHWMAAKLADYLWRREFGSDPISYVNPFGIVGNFLYNETAAPSIAQALLVHMRWATAELDPQSVTLSPHLVTFLFEGVPAIQDVVVRSDVDQVPLASWAGLRHYGDPISLAFHKGDQETVSIGLKTPAGVDRPSPVVEALNPGRGIDLISGGFPQADFFTATVPVDAPEGAFTLNPAAGQEAARHLAFLSGNQPMVLHAPGYWMPFPAQVPAVRWYFNVPEHATGAAIFFEGPATLYTPSGETFHQSDLTSEWVDLPAAQAGLWSFAAHGTGMVRVRNLPPFFAAEDPNAYFDPGLEWTPRHATDQTAASFPESSGFMPGGSGKPDDQALFIAPTGSFSIPGGDDLGDGKGREFLPFHQGTIEFWIRPAWGSFTLDTDSITLFRMPAPGRRWDLTFEIEASHFNHTLYAYAIGQDPNGNRRSFRSWRGYTVFEPGEWTHVALTWGQGASPNPNYGDGLTFTIYVDGQAGSQLHFAGTRGFLPADLPSELLFPNLNAAISQLHISDVIRYSSDSSPPSRLDPTPTDAHTRAFLPLNGSLQGSSATGANLKGTLVH